MPSSGKRYGYFRNLSRFFVCFIFAVFVAGILIYDTIAEKFVYSIQDETSSQETAAVSYSEDELEAALYEMILPERFSEYADDVPTALEIYDRLYAGEKVDTPADGGDVSEIPEDALIIVSSDISRSPADGEILLSNQTSYSPDIDDILAGIKNKDDISVFNPITSSGPLVLIIHTHGTEAYADEDKTSYTTGNLPRSDDIMKNIVAVGAVFCETLNSNGIPAIHCEIMHDRESFINAYSYAKKTILSYLDRYPSIRYVFDIHRDAIITKDSIIKAVTYDNGEAVAQIMFVVGTNESGADHPNWQKNLSAAVNAQYLLNKRLTNFARPINIRSASFNEQYTEGSLLIEIGTCGNTLAEAQRAAAILGEELAKLILSR